MEITDDSITFNVPEEFKIDLIVWKYFIAGSPAIIQSGLK